MPSLNIPDQSDQNFYALFRQQVVAEDALINYRMTWLLLQQGLLLALLAGSLAQGSHEHFLRFDVFKWMICMAGMGGSLLIGIGIRAAHNAICCLCEGYVEAYGGKSNLPKNLPQLLGGEHSHAMGILPLYLPGLCFLIWFGIAWFVH